MTTDLHQQLAAAEAQRREILNRRQAESDARKREDQQLAESEAEIRQLTRQRHDSELRQAVEQLQTHELAANRQAVAALHIALDTAATSGVIDLKAFDPITRQLETSFQLVKEGAAQVYGLQQHYNEERYLDTLPADDQATLANHYDQLRVSAYAWASARGGTDISIPEPIGLKSALGDWIGRQGNLNRQKLGAMVGFFYTGVVITPAN